MSPDEIIAVARNNRATLGVVHNAEKEAVKQSGALDLILPTDEDYAAHAESMGLDVSNGITAEIKRHSC